MHNMGNTGTQLVEYRTFASNPYCSAMLCPFTGRFIFPENLSP